MRTATKKTVATVKNRAGGDAFALSNEMALYSAAVTSTLSDTYYEKEDERTDRIRALVKATSPSFVARVAVYARDAMYLRTMPVVLAVELAKVHNGNDLVSRLVERVIKRPDQIGEMLAYYKVVNGEVFPLSTQIRKGLVAAFNKFDEYQFAKWDSNSAAFSLKDALRIVRPKAESKDQSALFDKIYNGTLETPYTWETEFSKLGEETKGLNEAGKTAAFKAKWEEIVKSGRLGYMAMLRNLANFDKFGVDQGIVDLVCDVLSTKSKVEKAQQFPFRFLSAWKMTQNVKYRAALEKAVRYSVDTLKGFDEKDEVVIACDVSGSMHATVSPKSQVKNVDIGMLLGFLLKQKCQTVDHGMFGDRWATMQEAARTDVDFTGDILHDTQAAMSLDGAVGYSTNGYKVIEAYNKSKAVRTKFFMFTDGQMWNSDRSSSNNGAQFHTEWAKYKQEVNPEAKMYLFNLAGYGDAPLEVDESNGVYMISGWSDKIFDVLDGLENKKTALDAIKAIDL